MMIARDMNLLQYATSVDKDIGLLVYQAVVTILDLNVPFALVLVPRRFFDRVSVFDEFVAIVLIRNIVHIRVNLL